ncbi:hypothetical protein BBJ29_004614 [Phytophthora kernoviae]|uniref:Uncharacterized protein n=1 Tax=Phytophthora kernoviae TaxID=325452 RepID=A0A3F2RJD9_9STRA|nr:hypothetical protein BBP00_00006990 [Phytophthora kernoviae]RLN66555.1 hypothetical protein BBJ29_004614 [Phytophthora kernoviae]
MLVSNNDEEPEEAPVESPADAKQPEDEWARDAVHGLALSPKDPLAHEMASMLQPQSMPESNDDETAPSCEDDEMPMLESERTSFTTPQEPIMITASTVDEPVDRLSDSVPEGELHVWVSATCQCFAGF